MKAAQTVAEKEMRVLFSYVMHSPYRFLLAAGLIAALMCLFPARVDAPQQSAPLHAQEERPAMPAEAAQPARLEEAPVHADLSERTAQGCYLHKTSYYAPCGHSVQRRADLPAQLIGLSRQALEKELPGVLEGAAVTGFSGGEVDVSISMPIPCPLHWVLRAGESGKLEVLQNATGETLDVVRETDIPLSHAGENERQALVEGRIFDDVQALEGYLESLSS